MGSLLLWWICFRANKWRTLVYFEAWWGTRCRVSYLDSRNIEHAVDVTADSLFEAVAVAVRAFREGALVDELPVAGTELRIAVFPMPIEHKVRLQRVEQWAQTGTVKSPVEMLRRERVRELLGLKNETVR